MPRERSVRVTIGSNLPFCANTHSRMEFNSDKQRTFVTKKRGLSMIRRTCAALLATTLLTATPAMARDKTLYVGVEGGLLMAKDMDVELTFEGESVVEDFIEIE